MIACELTEKKAARAIFNEWVTAPQLEHMDTPENKYADAMCRVYCGWGLSKFHYCGDMYYGFMSTIANHTILHILAPAVHLYIDYAKTIAE